MGKTSCHWAEVLLFGGVCKYLSYPLHRALEISSPLINLNPNNEAFWLIDGVVVHTPRLCHFQSKGKRLFPYVGTFVILVSSQLSGCDQAAASNSDGRLYLGSRVLTGCIP